MYPRLIYDDYRSYTGAETYVKDIIFMSSSVPSGSPSLCSPAREAKFVDIVNVLLNFGAEILCAGGRLDQADSEIEYSLAHKSVLDN